VLIGSGLRYDLAVRSPEYVKELVTHHVGGLLKIAPEHTEDGPLDKMMKPGIGTYDRFKEMFERFSKEAGKKQHLIPYFIAAHPGTTDEDMVNLALWLKANNFKLDQVQTFMPTPMAMATTMYHTGKNPCARCRRILRPSIRRSPAASAASTRRCCATTIGGLAADPRGPAGDGPGRPDRRPPRHLVPRDQPVILERGDAGKAGGPRSVAARPTARSVPGVPAARPACCGGCAPRNRQVTPGWIDVRSGLAPQMAGTFRLSSAPDAGRVFAV
jgi:hypothetical protein